MPNEKQVNGGSQGEAMAAKEKTWLAVPYEEREEAKALGGRLKDGQFAIDFDEYKKCWFALPGADLSKLSQWLPENRVSVSTDDMEAQLELVLQAHGFVIEGSLQLNGSIKRVRTSEDKSGQRSGVYCFKYDPVRPSCWYRDHRNDTEVQWWVYEGEQLDAATLAAAKAMSEERAEASKAAREARYIHHARRCRQVYRLLLDADSNHPYLVKKGVPVFPGVKQDRKGRLVIPLYDENGRIWSLQRISSTGMKRYKKLARKEGLFFVLSYQGTRLQDDDLVPMAEGYSTAADLATGLLKPVVMALDAYNMPTVAEKLSAKYPKATLGIFGDDDATKENNTGRKIAERIVGERSAFSAFPEFDPERQQQNPLSDWNDLRVHYGKEELYRQLRIILQEYFPAALPVPALKRS